MLADLPTSCGRWWWIGKRRVGVGGRAPSLDAADPASRADVERRLVGVDHEKGAASRRPSSRVTPGARSGARSARPGACATILDAGPALGHQQQPLAKRGVLDAIAKRTPADLERVVGEPDAAALILDPHAETGLAMAVKCRPEAERLEHWLGAANQASAPGASNGRVPGACAAVRLNQGHLQAGPGSKREAQAAGRARLLPPSMAGSPPKLQAISLFKRIGFENAWLQAHRHRRQARRIRTLSSIFSYAGRMPEFARALSKAAANDVRVRSAGSVRGGVEANGRLSRRFDAALLERSSSASAGRGARSGAPAPC